VRLGTVAKGLNGGVVVFGKNIASFSKSLSVVFESSGVCDTLSVSNILKSPERLAACTLRRFAEGLPRDARSRFIMPSLRFIGLTTGYEPNVPLRRFSIRDADGREEGVPSIYPAGSIAHASIPPPISSGERLIPGTVEEFSTPGVVEIPCSGFAFPWSVETLSARLTGLRGEVRARRIGGRDILALGGYGMANGDW
jgi:hypothetical protein